MLYATQPRSSIKYLDSELHSFSFIIFFMLSLVRFSDKYVTDAQSLHEHVMRHNHGTDENGTSINCLKLGFDTEYPF